MTRWVAIFQDRPREVGEPIRKQFGQAHFDYLAQHADKILIGGGLRPDPDSWYSGGLWVMETSSREEAVALVEADPYFVQGLRERYTLFVWGKAPCYGAVPL